MNCGRRRVCRKSASLKWALKDNFWQMGDTGPCGPCSEIYYDMGPLPMQGMRIASSPATAGGMLRSGIWSSCSLTGMPAGNNPLPKPWIDTGMGLERTAAVLQGVISNYETDLFTPLIDRAEQLVGMNIADRILQTGQEIHNKTVAASLRVIADHSRATAFLIADGVVPSNEGRGYVLRKIMRRAMRHAWLLGQKRPVVMTEMVILVQKMMADAYPGADL